MRGTSGQTPAASSHIKAVHSQCLFFPQASTELEAFILYLKQPEMSLKHRESMPRKQSQPPANRFGVHFEYQDLCSRLKDLESQQNLAPSGSVKLLPRKQSRVPSQKQRSLLSTYANSGELKKVLKAKQTDSLLNASKSALNRSFTPNKLRTRKILNATVARPQGKQPVRHTRQASLPFFVEPLPHKAGLRSHKKSDSIYSTVDF